MHVQSMHNRVQLQTLPWRTNLVNAVISTTSSFIPRLLVFPGPPTDPLHDTLTTAGRSGFDPFVSVG